jgi:uncharacterized membrane protein YtjA (UPF0391 family)
MKGYDLSFIPDYFMKRSNIQLVSLLRGLVGLGGVSAESALNAKAISVTGCPVPITFHFLITLQG